MAENQPPQKQTVPQPQTIPETPPTPIKPNKTPFVIMSVITVLSLLLSGYLAYQNVQLKKQITQPTDTTSSTETLDPIKGWKTYTNPVLNFSFKTPTKYYIYDQGEFSADVVIVDQDLNDLSSGTGATFQITIALSKDLSLEDSLAHWQRETGGFESETISLSGKTAEKGFTISKMEKAPTVWMEHQGSLLLITLTTPSDENRQIFDQILSTFEFADETAGWETYTNNLLGINFKHPYTVYENTDLVQLSESKEGGIVILTSNLIDSSKLALCNVEIEQTECLNVENNTDSSKRTEKVEIGGKDATSFYYWERQGNSILQVIEFANPNFQFLSFIDGVGLKETVGQILSTFEFID